MKTFRVSVAVIISAFMLSVAGGAWGDAGSDWFEITFSPGFTPSHYAGSGYSDESGYAPWYWYPNTEWYNQWFYNGPLDQARWKVISGCFLVRGTQASNSVEAVLNWSTEEWPPGGPPPLPPLSPAEETLYIHRTSLIAEATNVSTVAWTPFFFYEEVVGYNPEWVSIDILGNDVEIEGVIYHACLPQTDPGTRYGVNFTVEKGAVGLPSTGVNVDPDNENDIYIGGNFTNYKRLDGPDMALLGLVTDDDIDAISYGDPSTYVEVVRELPSQELDWHFSVDESAQGVAASGVANEVAVGTMPGGGSVVPSPPEALGDYFRAEPFNPVNMNKNWLVGDEEQLGLAIGDDLNGLDLRAEPIVNAETIFFQPGQVYFSLKAGSPSLVTYGVHQADILTPDGKGGIKVAGPGDGVLAFPGDHVSLGIPEDNDLDALFVDLAGVPFFSVETLIPGVVHWDANPGDILVPDGFLWGLDGVADEYIWARSIGLQTLDNWDAFDDNLDALDVETSVIEPPAELQQGVADTHAAVGGDTDGDGLPDSVEDGGGVYVGPLQTGTSSQNTDSDGDGFSDMLETILGSDPNVAGSNSPFTPVWVDFGSTETVELGNQNYPTKTLADAVRQVSAGGTLKITDASGTDYTTETPTVTKAMRIEAVNGPIRIGGP
jgi:hypothetical protein